MSKIGLLVCGNSGIDYEKVDYPFNVIHSQLIIDNKAYEDYVDITAEEFYQKIEVNPDVPLSTAQAATGEFIKALEELKAEGYQEIIVITISSKLSGTYQNAVLAKEMVDDVKIYVVDSLSVSYGQMILVKETIKLIKAGKSGKEIEEVLLKTRENIFVYVLVDTLKFLVKNGRLSAASGALGSLLRIKPLLHINRIGQLVPFEKIRTSSKARKRLLEIAFKEIDEGVEEFFLAYTNNKEYVEEFNKDINKQHLNLKIHLCPLTPVVGAHACPGTCGFGFLKKK